MKMVLLHEDVLDYLLNGMFRRELASGMISAEELPLATKLWEQLSKAQTVDFSKLGPAALDVQENGVVVEIGEATSSQETAEEL